MVVDRGYLDYALYERWTRAAVYFSPSRFYRLRDVMRKLGPATPILANSTWMRSSGSKRQLRSICALCPMRLPMFNLAFFACCAVILTF